MQTFILISKTTTSGADMMVGGKSKLVAKILASLVLPHMERSTRRPTGSVN